MLWRVAHGTDRFQEKCTQTTRLELQQQQANADSLTSYRSSALTPLAGKACLSPDGIFSSHDDPGTPQNVEEDALPEQIQPARGNDGVLLESILSSSITVRFPVHFFF